MFVFDERSVKQLFGSALKDAKERLACLEVCCSGKPSFRGLSGWVFEQTIQYCLHKELEAKGIKADFEEQVSLGGSRKADLRVGTVLMEFKLTGLFGPDAAKRYGKRSDTAQRKGYSYVYLTAQETYKPYRKAVKEALPRGNAFFVDETKPGEWERFVRCIFKRNHWEDQARTCSLGPRLFLVWGDELRTFRTVLCLFQQGRITEFLRGMSS